jgi:hypothetical protein
MFYKIKEIEARVGGEDEGTAGMNGSWRGAYGMHRDRRNVAS